MTFNPENHKPKGGGGGAFGINVPLDVAGRFVFVFTYAGKIEESRNGFPFLNAKAVVIDGRPSGHDGEHVWDRIFLHEDAYARLGGYCHAMKYTKTFSPLQLRELLPVFLFRPFVATSRVENGYTNIAFPESNRSESEEAAIEKWVARYGPKREEWVSKALSRIGSEGGGRSSGGGYSGGGRGQTPPPADPFPDDDFADDDIPF